MIAVTVEWTASARIIARLRERYHFPVACIFHFNNCACIEHLVLCICWCAQLCGLRRHFKHRKFATASVIHSHAQSQLLKLGLRAPSSDLLLQRPLSLRLCCWLGRSRNQKDNLDRVCRGDETVTFTKNMQFVLSIRKHAILLRRSPKHAI